MIPTAHLTNTEKWNGTNWTEVNNLNTGRSVLGSSTGGTTTFAFVFGGEPGFVANTEEWNGVSWVEVADLSVGRFFKRSRYNNSAGLAFGGQISTPALSASTEEWSSSSNVVLTD